MILESDIISIVSKPDGANHIIIWSLGMNCDDIKISVTSSDIGYSIYANGDCCGFIPADTVSLISYGKEKFEHERRSDQNGTK